MKTALIALAALATSITATAREHVVLEMGNDFNSITSSAPVDIYLTNQSDSAGMVVYDIEPELKDLLKFNVDNSELEITLDTKNYPGETSNIGKRISTVRIYVPKALLKLKQSGSGDIDAKVGLNVASEGLLLRVSGSGDIELEKFRTSNLDIIVSGSGDIDLKRATVDVADFKISGSGEISGSKFKARDTRVSISGSGEIELTGATHSASYNVTGSGDITCRHYGADIVSAKVSGSGDITCHAAEMIVATASGSGEIKVFGNPASAKISGNKENIKIKR